MRQTPTDAEALLWSKLRDRRLAGYKFRRQHPIAGYFADFACIESNLVIELDGGQHAMPHSAQRDQARSAILSNHGFHVLRFWNNDVLQNITGVLETILQFASSDKTSSLTPTLSRQREREQDHKDNTP
ncbi:MAG: endonuclease domain-containing protein [Brachymonas sp.]|nr:endonuclease domain-containing protein [Brachymonas sp.]